MNKKVVQKTKLKNKILKILNFFDFRKLKLVNIKRLKVKADYLKANFNELV